ncbi:MAG: LamG-like jellyroll fold domain-containing protein [Fuerstiella sp.]
MSVDDELIDRFLDGELTSDETASVVEWLESAANLRYFANRAELHVDLRGSLRRRGIQESAMDPCEPTVRVADLDQRVASPARAVGVHFKALLYIGVATVASLLFTLWGVPKGPPPDSSQRTLATIVSEVDALLTGKDIDWEQAELVAGDYQLKRGLLNLRFDGGVMVYVEAPAEFNIISGKRLVLQHGRLSASVPPEGIGFTVDTPEAKVVDFGTEFSVDVQSGTSEVHVFDGLVRVQPRRMQDGMKRNAVDLRTSQAVKIKDGAQKPVDIKLATERFIRNFDEPKRKYIRSLRRLSPVAFYRMAIRDKGLLSEPPQYSGEVFTGPGTRPPHARGVFAGGSLRVGTSSIGRGGRVKDPPPLTTGQFTLAVFVYLEKLSPTSTVATNLHIDRGNFALLLNQEGTPHFKAREINGGLHSVVSSTPLPLTTWRHLVVTADGDQIRLYEDGQRVASTPCQSLAITTDETVWFGIDSSGSGIWNGRIDEVGLFDKALNDREVAELFQAAVEEMARAE